MGRWAGDRWPVGRWAGGPVTAGRWPAVAGGRWAVAGGAVAGVRWALAGGRWPLTKKDYCAKILQDWNES